MRAGVGRPVAQAGRGVRTLVVMATFFKKWLVSCHGCKVSCATSTDRNVHCMHVQKKRKNARMYLKRDKSEGGLTLPDRGRSVESVEMRI